MRNVQLKLTISLFLIGVNGTSALSNTCFRSNDRVVFIGDSITHAGMFHTYIQAFYATRFPEKNVIIYNLGIAGDTAKGAVERCSVDEKGLWESDVRSYKPTTAVVMLGMNDASNSIFNDALSSQELEEKSERRIQWFEDNYAKIIDRLEILQIKPIRLVKSSPYDQTMKNLDAKKNLYNFGFGKNDLIRRMAAEVIDAEADKRKIETIDFNTPMIQYNQVKQKFDPAFSIIGLDRVHPGVQGHMFMAYLFLRSQNIERVVSEFAIDFKTLGVLYNKNCDISILKSDLEGGLIFEYQARSIPFPVDLYKPYDLPIPFEEEMNQEEVVIKNLKRGLYKMEIDGIFIGTFDEKELEDGINIAGKAITPQGIQAKDVWELCQKRAKISSLLRNIIWSDNQLRKKKDIDRSNVTLCIEEVNWMLENDKSLTLYMRRVLGDYIENIHNYDALREKIDTLSNEIYAKAQPMCRTFELIPIREVGNE